MPANWSKRAEVLLRVYPRHVGSLPGPVERVLRAALVSPPELSPQAFFALKYAFLSAQAIDKVDEEGGARKHGGFADFHREKRIAEMKRRIEALDAALAAGS